MSRKSRSSRPVKLEERQQHHLKEAIRYESEKSPTRASHHASKTLELNPDNTAALLIYARTAVLTGHPQKALEKLDRLESLLDDRLDAGQTKQAFFHILIVRTTALEKTGDPEAAETTADALVELTPEKHLAFLNRAAIRFERKNFRGALDDLHHATSMVGPNASLQCLIGENYQSIAFHHIDHPHPDYSPEQSLDEARNYFHRAVHHLHTAADLDPQHPGAGPALEHLLTHAEEFGLYPDGSEKP